MPKFSQASMAALATCHPDLQVLFNEVVKYFDCTVIEGYRGQEAQDKAFRDGKSQLPWPKGRHNTKPSLAVDVAPYHKGIKWDKPNDFLYFGGFVQGIAQGLLIQGKMTHAVRYGGDFNQNQEVTDDGFKDLVHYELVVNQ